MATSAGRLYTSELWSQRRASALGEGRRDAGDPHLALGSKEEMETPAPTTLGMLRSWHAWASALSGNKGGGLLGLNKKETALGMAYR